VRAPARKGGDTEAKRGNKMKNAGTVLLYNCSAPEFSKLKQIFAMLRLRMRVVEPDRYHLPLEELAQGKGEAGK